jgi:hypothetical protein
MVYIWAVAIIAGDAYYAYCQYHLVANYRGVGCRAGIALIGAMVKGGGKLVTSYFLLSFLLGPIAIVWLIFDGRKACPFCHNILKPSLKVCPHCDHRLVYPHL